MFHGTTILSVRFGGSVVMAGDGQVSVGDTVFKSNAKKVRRLYHGEVLAGFAGGTADAFTLFERFEGKLDQLRGNLLRSAVELAKDWRTDRILRKLDAMLVVADKGQSLLISGNGDVVEPENDVIAIGSGGAYARGAARALLLETSLDAKSIVETAMSVAGEICVYTNTNITLEQINLDKKKD